MVSRTTMITPWTRHGAVQLLLLSLAFAILLFGQVSGEEQSVTHKVRWTISVGGSDLGLITLGLFGKTVPKTVDNFVALSSKEGVDGHTYQGSSFHRVIPFFMIQGGDVTLGSGRGGTSIYGGGNFPDENFHIKHSRTGIISMANSGKDTNRSQFFITTEAAPHLDSKHVVFGIVLTGYDVIAVMETTPTGPTGRPTKEILIKTSEVEELPQPIPVRF